MVKQVKLLMLPNNGVILEQTYSLSRDFLNIGFNLLFGNLIINILSEITGQISQL